MHDKFTKKDIVIMLFALIAVAGMVVFLVYVQKMQNDNQQQLQQQGQQLVDENENNKDREDAEKLVILTALKDSAVEVYNGGKVKVSLENYTICLNGEIVHTFSNSDEIEAKSTIVVGTNINVSNPDSDVITFFSPDGTMLMQTLCHLLEKDDSGLMFSVASGFYNETISVEILASGNCKIYYTLDGTIPTADSQQYTEAVDISFRVGEEPVCAAKDGISPLTSYVPGTIDKATILSVICVDENGKIIETAQNAYFIGLGNKNAYNNMPVLSITADVDDLFDYNEGIYVAGRDYEDKLAAALDMSEAGNYYRGRIVEAYLQYFEETRGITYSAPVLMEILPDSFSAYPQKSIQLTANGVEAGKASTLSTYLQGKNGSVVLGNAKADFTTKTRDILSKKLLENSAVTVLPVEACTVFLNGEYWGVYTISMPIDNETLGSIYGIDSDNVLVIRTGDEEDTVNEMYKEFTSFVITGDMTIEANYEKVCSMLDMQNYLEYVCANIYLGNSAWPMGNEYMWRSIEIGEGAFEDGKWRFIWNDIEQSMGNSTLSSYSLNTYLRPMIAEDPFLYSLMRNTEFRQQFADTMNQMMNKYFSVDVVDAALMDITESYGKGIVASYVRFMGNFSIEAYNQRTEVIRTFFANRKEYILEYTTEFLNVTREQLVFGGLE